MAMAHLPCLRLAFTFLFASLLLCKLSESRQPSHHFVAARKPLGDSPEDNVKQIKKLAVASSKNQTKSSLHTVPFKNQTQLIKTTNSTKTTLPLKIESKKLNSTNSPKIKKLNSTTKKSSDPTKTTTKIQTSKDQEKTTTKEQENSKKQKIQSSKVHEEKKPKIQVKKKQTTKQASWLDLNDEDEEETDLVSELADLPMRFQQTLIPDLQRISTTSKAYLNRANKEMTKGFKPIVGQRFASTVASLVSFAFMLIPLVLVSLLFTRIKAYFSLQKLVIFVQAYLAIYFLILCVSALATGLEPLRFFYAASRNTYVCVQVIQTLGYVLYLMVLLMYLILVFSTECGVGSKLVGLGQAAVGLSVGLHYYVAVFHRVVLHQPPRTNWKVHGAYATCFAVICACAAAERRKKAYLEDGGQEGKKN